MIQSRLKSKVTWMSIIAQVISLGQFIGIFEKYGIDAGVVGDVAASILQLLVVFGILNNPTDSGHF